MDSLWEQESTQVGEICLPYPAYKGHYLQPHECLGIQSVCHRIFLYSTLGYFFLTNCQADLNEKSPSVDNVHTTLSGKGTGERSNALISCVLQKEISGCRKNPPLITNKVRNAGSFWPTREMNFTYGYRIPKGRPNCTTPPYLPPAVSLLFASILW